MNDIGEFFIPAALVGVFALLVFLFVHAAEKEAQDRAAFMSACEEDKKGYECQVLWAQTDESKRTRDMAISTAAGAAIGVAAGRR